MGKKSKAKKDAFDSSSRVPLLGDDGDCSPSFKRVIIELFQRFDTDGNKRLDEKELLVFSGTANVDGRQFDRDELDQIKEHFDWKTGPDEGLTLRGWVEMWHTQTGGDEEETWRDLKSLGYNEKLERVGKRTRTCDATLQTQLEEFLALGDGGDVEGLVAAFAPEDYTAEERSQYLEGLKADGAAKLAQLLAEIRCCATGEGVTEVEEETTSDGESQVVFNFLPLSASGEGGRSERSAVFAKLEGGQWRAEDGWRLELL